MMATANPVTIGFGTKDDKAPPASTVVKLGSILVGIEGLLTQEFEAVAGGSPTLQMQTVAQVLTQSQLKLSKPEVDTLLTAAQLAAKDAQLASVLPTPETRPDRAGVTASR